MGFDAQERRRKLYGFQCGAAPERVRRNGLHAVRDRDFRQRFAAGKCALADQRDRVRNLQFEKRPALRERLRADFRNALRQNDTAQIARG